MATIDLSGNREEMDVDYLARHFHHGIHFDRQGLAMWIHSLNDLSTVGEQDRLQTKLAGAKLTTPPAQVTTHILEKHCTDVLSVWKKIVGNDISAPASFNSRLLSWAQIPLVDYTVSYFHFHFLSFRQRNQCKRERWDRILVQVTFFNEVPCPPALRFTISWSTGGLTL